MSFRTRSKRKPETAVHAPAKKLKKDTKLKKKEEASEKTTPMATPSKWKDMAPSSLINLIQYLRKLWLDDPNARVIMFSQECYAKREGVKSFKKADSEIRVLLMSLQSTASGSNLIAATHIILMDPVKRTKKESLATEQQAIRRSHRQGQDKQVTIVRFIVKKTIEYDTYVQNYLADESETQGNDTKKPNLAHSNSIEAVLAKTPTVRRSRSVIEFVSNLQ